MRIIVTYLQMEKLYKFKASNKNNSFPSQFCLESITNEFNSNDLGEVSLKGNVYDFSIDYRAIDISNILNIHKCFVKQSKVHDSTHPYWFTS